MPGEKNSVIHLMKTAKNKKKNKFRNKIVLCLQVDKKQNWGIQREEVVGGSL